MIERLTQREQEALLQRYFSGGMNAEEESTFFVQVALDADLRRALKAHSLVRDMLEEQRATPPIDHHLGRERLVETLAAARRLPTEGSPARRSKWPWLYSSAGLLLLLAATMVVIEHPTPSETTPTRTEERLTAPSAQAERPEQLPGTSPAPAAIRGGGSTAAAPSPSRTQRAAGPTHPHTTVIRSAAADRPSSISAPPVDPVPAHDTAIPRAPALDTIRLRNNDTVTLRLRVKKTPQ